MTIDRLLDEADAMGVDTLEMGPLAQRLGVATGTLYGYVHSREHLVFLLASRHLKLAEVQDRGQSWQDVLREHATLTFDRLRKWPQLIVNLVTGNIAPDFGAYTLRSVTTMLAQRGISHNWSRRLYIETNQIVLGAVVVSQFIEAVTSETSRREQLEATIGYAEDFGRFEPGLERLITWFESLDSQRTSSTVLDSDS